MARDLARILTAPTTREAIIRVATLTSSTRAIRFSSSSTNYGAYKFVFHNTDFILGHDVTLFATGDSVTKARLEYVFEEAPGSKTINDIVLDTTHTLSSLRDATSRREERFQEQLRAEQSKSKVLDRKFQEGLKKANDSPDPPLNPMDMD